MRQAGDNGAQLSVCAEVEAYGDQSESASNLFCCKTGRSQAGSLGSATYK